MTNRILNFKEGKEFLNRPKNTASLTDAYRPINDLLYVPLIKQKLQSPGHIVKASTNQISLLTDKLLHKYSPLNTTLHEQTTQITTQQNMDLMDEQFVEQFAALSSRGEQSQPVHLPRNGLANRSWHLCVISRIVTDKATIDNHFAATMMKAWGVDPAKEISILKHNMFLVQFTNKEDLKRVMQRAIWTYKMDVDILKRVNGPTKLEQPRVDMAKVWTQWHRVPLAALSKEGIIILAHRLGTPLYEPVELFTGGNKFYKIKVLLNIKEKLQDNLEVHHPDLGDFSIYITY